MEECERQSLGDLERTPMGQGWGLQDVGVESSESKDERL